MDTAALPQTPLRVLRIAARAAWAMVAILGSVLAGVGWLYLFRNADWFVAGPRIGDALPLLQLAGADGQALLRVAVAFVLAGLIAGICLRWASPPRRLMLVAPVGLAWLLFFSQVSFAVARNVPLGQVLFSRQPGAGPWIEGGLLALACLLPGRRRRGMIVLAG
jgi:hypothetical protein